VNLAYAAAGAVISQRFAALQSGMRWLERVAGVLFMGFGLKLALTDNPVQ
jgi:threonine/homoserine/homoserine lactone efflux protein